MINILSIVNALISKIENKENINNTEILDSLNEIKTIIESSITTESDTLEYNPEIDEDISNNTDLYYDDSIEEDVLEAENNWKIYKKMRSTK